MYSLAEIRKAKEDSTAFNPFIHAISSLFFCQRSMNCSCHLIKDIVSDALHFPTFSLAIAQSRIKQLRYLTLSLEKDDA
jgi:hypothetical protein